MKCNINVETHETIPEIFLLKNRNEAERKSDVLSLFLSPIPSESAKDTLHDIKNLAAAMDFLEGNTMAAYNEGRGIIQKLDAYLNVKNYINMIKESSLTNKQQDFFILLAIVYSNAEKLSLRYDVGDSLDENQEKMKYLEMIKSVIQIMLVIAAEKMPDDVFCRTVNSRLKKLNDVLVVMTD